MNFTCNILPLSTYLFFHHSPFSFNPSVSPYLSLSFSSFFFPSQSYSLFMYLFSFLPFPPLFLVSCSSMHVLYSGLQLRWAWKFPYFLTQTLYIYIFFCPDYVNLRNRHQGIGEFKCVLTFIVRAPPSVTPVQVGIYCLYQPLYIYHILHATPIYAK